jgi:hypothetical protein
MHAHLYAGPPRHCRHVNRLSRSPPAGVVAARGEGNAAEGHVADAAAVPAVGGGLPVECMLGRGVQQSGARCGCCLCRRCCPTTPHLPCCCHCRLTAAPKPARAGQRSAGRRCCQHAGSHCPAAKLPCSPQLHSQAAVRVPDAQPLKAHLPHVRHALAAQLDGGGA